MVKAKRFGAFGGVFTPSILTILGVIMYLRLPWIVGQAGLMSVIGIILVAHIISGSTGLSVASIATDKRVETGGPYFIISRSLGLPIGGTLGFALFIGFSFSVSLYLIGFAEVFLGYFGFEVTLTTIRLAGSIILFFTAIITFISTSLAIKTQYIILAAIVLSMVSVFTGNHEFNPSFPQLGSIPGSLPWITLFAIFFPAVTGFGAGVSMSGDLKDPRKAIPVGTLSAILVGLIIYLALAIFLSYTVDRDLLVSDPNVLFKISFIPQLVVAGILGATLSSALGAILGAPRILQAIAKDRIAPKFFGKGYGASNEPRNALIIAYIIAQAGILIGELNVIARIVSIFFIITYGFLNITYTVESWASSDFRPSFKIPRIVSIIGAFACIIVMIQLDVLAMIVASLILAGLFFYLKKQELTLQTGDTRSSIWLSLVRTGLLELTKSQTQTRNWRPNVILFSGGAKNRPHLIRIGKALVGKLGIFTSFELIEHPDEPDLFGKTASVTAEDIGEHTNVITRRHVCNNIYEGIEMISRIYGFSGFEPNTILMGWAKNSRDPERFTDLMVNLKKLDYNLAFLSYDKQTGFGQCKKIDFWWDGKGRNLSFALHLIRFITVTPEWRRAEVRILAISPDSKHTERYYAIIGQMIDNYRIRASVKVISNIQAQTEMEIIRSESSDTDITLAGIPEFNKSKVENLYEHFNELTDKLKSCLLIHASTAFEEINIVSELINPKKATINVSSDKKPDISIINRLQLSSRDIIFNEVYNIARIIEESTKKMIENTILSIPENMDAYLDKLKTLSKNTSDKMIKAADIESQQEKQWEHLKIINDHCYYSLKQLSLFKEQHLAFKKEILQKGLEQYISEIKIALDSLPEIIRLRFGKEDYRKIRTTNPLAWLLNSIEIIWLGISKKELSYKIKIQPAARYFLLHKRLRYFENFFERYTSQSLMHISEISKFLKSSLEFSEKVNTGKITLPLQIAETGQIIQVITDIKNQNREFYYNECRNLTEEIINDLNNFSKIIESPQANSHSRKFKLKNKQNEQTESAITEFPSLWLHITTNNLNKSYLDFIYLSLKNRLKTKIEKSLLDLEIVIDNNLRKKYKAFEKHILDESSANNSKKSKSRTFSQKSIFSPGIEEHFSNLLNEIREAIDDLPENIEIAGYEFFDDIKIDDVKNTEEFLVSVRKTGDFYISNELNEQIKKQWINLEHELSVSVANIKDLIRLANFNLLDTENSQTDYSEQEKTNEQREILKKNIIKNINIEENKLRQLTQDIRKGFETGLMNAFEPLSSAFIINAEDAVKIKNNNSGKKILFHHFETFFNTLNKKFSEQIVKLMYSKSEGLIWARRIEGSREELSYFTNEPVKQTLDRVSPGKTVLQSLPFYYSNLFSGNSVAGEDFWVGMKHEIERGKIAIKRFQNGLSGALIISGERTAGKTSLSKHLAHKYFPKDNIFSVRAPRECIADANLFEQTLIKTLHSSHHDLSYILESLPPNTAIIINDLELWWERKPFGTQVIERIISLIKQYGHNILFIINVNKFALRIIDQLSSLNTWSIDLIFCQPMDARELKDMILIRHQAGGLKFIMNNKHESQMTGYDYARLFNRLFALSNGNPGYCINLWLAGIKKVNGNTLIMEKPGKGNIVFSGNISQYEMMYIMQFIMHRRFSVRSLAEVLQNDEESTEKTLRMLLQKGILIEKFPEVYSLNPSLEIPLVEKLKNMEWL